MVYSSAQLVSEKLDLPGYAGVEFSLATPDTQERVERAEPLRLGCGFL